MGQENIVKKYKTWFDTKSLKLVTYDRRWKRADWEHLIYIGELQANQKPFQFDGRMIYRDYYKGKKIYYFWVKNEMHTPVSIWEKWDTEFCQFLYSDYRTYKEYTAEARRIK